MADYIQCPECDTYVRAPGRHSRMPLRCPACRAVIDDPDDDDDPPPRRKPPTGAFVALGIALGTLGLAGLVAAVLAAPHAFEWWQSGVPSGPPAPPGFSVAGSRAAGFRVFLPGMARPTTFLVANNKPDPAWVGFGSGDVRGLFGSALAFRPADGYTPAEAPDAMWADLTHADGFAKSPSRVVESKTPTTLGGRPALEVRAYDNKGWMLDKIAPDFPDLPESHRQFRQKMRDEQKARTDAEQKTAEHAVYYVTTDRGRVYVVKVGAAGRYPDPGVLKTVADSFQFAR